MSTTTTRKPPRGWTEDDILTAAEQIASKRLSGKTQIGDPATARRYVAARMRLLRHEVFSLLLLDNQHAVTGYRELFRGTIDGASVYPRDVVSTVLDHGAAAIILVHNHPSGIPEPSLADRQITRRLTEALALIDVCVLDHLIVGGAGCTSFAERGLL